MSDNVLSQAEVESLLNAMETSAEPTKGPAAPAADPGAPARAMRGREKITPYDFKRPERVGKDQMRALQSMQ
ncbi:MAG: flagellar motor switch protein FliM, partial [Bremerella sp.]